jgi:hypothetical protein
MTSSSLVSRDSSISTFQGPRDIPLTMLQLLAALSIRQAFQLVKKPGNGRTFDCALEIIENPDLKCDLLISAPLRGINNASVFFFKVKCLSAPIVNLQLTLQHN